MELFFQWLIERYESLYCCFIVRPYERAVHIRYGELNRICAPGHWWKLPLGIDEIHKVRVTRQTTNLNTQVVMSVEDATYVVSVVVTWSIREEAVDKVVLNIEEDYEEYLNNTIYARTSHECRKRGITAKTIDDIENGIAEGVRRRLGAFGYNIHDLTITDTSKAKTLRLVSGE